MARKKRTNQPVQKRKKKELASAIIQFLTDNADKQYNYKQISAALDVSAEERRDTLRDILDKLRDDELILETSRGKYKTNNRKPILEGRFERRSNGKNFFVPNDEGNIVYIPERNSKNAMNGDIVRIQLFAKRKRYEAEGEVIEILERAEARFVGTLEVQANFAFLVLDSRILANDIFIPKEHLKGGKTGDKAVVEIVEWPAKANNPIGKVLDVLGVAGDNTTEMHAILAQYNLPYVYPKQVEDAAKKISAGITPQEIAKREDVRNTFTMTIDPADAKDFDDAISYKKLENGNHEIGVHIADVTHYVQPKTALEKEAYDRATSVYLVDRTIPMLPERLSNGLCSLRPNEDKLTFACVFEVDDEANVKKHWIGRTIINSDRRYAYEEAQENIDNQSGDYFEELTLLNVMAKKIRQRRFKHGAVNFETVEVKFKLDEKGTPLGLMVKERKDIHKLIEEFMLLANKYVAEFIFNKNKGKDTFIYRTHDSPDMERLDTFSGFARRFGHPFDIENENTISIALNKLMEEIQGKPEQNVLEQLAIRSMAKAKYTTEPKGHFGLAFAHYSHFTSPIRRYPDMMAHRLLAHYLEGGKSLDAEAWEQKCVHSSEREKRAADAERASIKYKQVEYMSLAEDKDYEGIVSGITEWGVFVEITETKCEGMIRVQDMDDDYYDFDQKNMRLVGSKTKKMITLGDKVKVRVVNTDIDRRTIDLEFADNDKKKPRARVIR